MGEFYEQVNDLYKLQVASYCYEHGIRDIDKWDIFEPTKFIYAFFTFNCLYSINWEETIKSKSVDYRDNGKTNKDGKIVPLNEVDKINRLIEFFMQHGGEDIHIKYQSYLKQLLPKQSETYLEELDDITIDTRITESNKKKFIKRFMKLMDINLKKDSFRRALKETHYFIYLVRNNIFHGSKTVTEMYDHNQKKRIEIYRSIILTTNEILFDILKNDGGWKNEQIFSDLAHKKTRESINNYYFMEKLDIRIPIGKFYYPSCGNDTEAPLSLFLGKSKEFHFADINEYPKLSALESSSSLYEIHRALINNPGSSGVISKKIVSAQVAQLEVSENLVKNQWTLSNESKDRVDIFLHKQDGIQVFNELDNISIFFYRGDSAGEGGSGQWWLGKELFDKILEKLADGGLIVTDGSNPDPRNIDTEWKELWKYRFGGGKHRSNRLDDFTYKKRKFSFVALIPEISNRRRITAIWQVHKMN